MTFAQERDSSDLKSADLLPLGIDANGQRVILRYQIPWRQFDVYSTSLPADVFDFVSRGADIKVSGIKQPRNDGSVVGVTLSMDGLSDVSVKLRKSCDESA